MKQLTRTLARATHRSGSTAGPRRWNSRPPDARIRDELAVIVEHRIGVPPPPGSVRPVIRPAVDEDRAAIEEMAARCSAETLRRRFHGPLGDTAPSKVATLLDGGSRTADHLVAEVDGAVVGVATLHRSSHHDGEMAVLVEDAWQGTGLGRRLTGHLIRRAGEHGVTTIVADIMREPAFVLDHLHRAIADSAVAFDGPVATVRIPVAAAARTAPTATA